MCTPLHCPIFQKKSNRIWAMPRMPFYNNETVSPIVVVHQKLVFFSFWWMLLSFFFYLLMPKRNMKSKINNACKMNTEENMNPNQTCSVTPCSVASVTQWFNPCWVQLTPGSSCLTARNLQGRDGSAQQKPLDFKYNRNVSAPSPPEPRQLKCFTLHGLTVIKEELQAPSENKNYYSSLLLI